MESVIQHGQLSNADILREKENHGLIINPFNKKYYHTEANINNKPNLIIKIKKIFN